MTEADLAAAGEVCEVAFRTFISQLVGRELPAPMFAAVMPAYRFGADPEGCHVAIEDGQIVGANFSIARGTLGFFGPLAVSPAGQGRGVGQQLVQACMESWRARGVRLMGLETFAQSPYHLHLYRKLGFEPAWTGLSLRRELEPAPWPDGVERVQTAPDAGYLYPGCDVTRDVEATAGLQGGAVLGCGGGFAICHTASALWPNAEVSHVPLLVAPDRDTFDRLLDACEHLAAEAGRKRLIVQICGSARLTLAALLERGYRLGSATVRMKQGLDPDYDAAPIYYIDDWH